MPGPSSTIYPLSEVPLPKLDHCAYLSQLCSLVCSISSQVADRIGAVPPVEPPVWTHVYLKVLSRKWSEPRWTGPFRVIARTSKAVQLEGKGHKWFHFCMIRPQTD